MQISPADRSIAVVVKADAAGAAAPVASSTTATGGAGTTASESLRAGVTQPPIDKTDYLSATDGASGPDKPSADADNSDWAATQKAADAKKEKEKEEIKPPLYELLIQQFNSLWRASSQAVDATTQTVALSQANRQNQTDNTVKSAPLVYTDPSKVRKASSTEGT